MQRLLRTFREDGAPALRHKARGRPSNNRLRGGVRDLALPLVRESYADFGPTLAAEKLAERHDLKVSRATLRKWMAENGLWLPRRQRRTFHQPRLRRERLGELVQVDGSEHRWFEDRGPACMLLVFIDDATSRLMQMRFVPAESTFSYFEALDGYLREHGRPVALHSDKHSIVRVAKDRAQSGHGMTQFGRALAEFNVGILRANLPDGRLEVRWKGVSLPYRAFDPDQQRVTYAAITENKRLGPVLEAIKEMQDAAAPEVTTVGKQRTRHRPKGGPRTPRKSWMDGRAARRAAEAAQATPAPNLAAE